VILWCECRPAARASRHHKEQVARHLSRERAAVGPRSRSACLARLLCTAISPRYGHADVSSRHAFNEPRAHLQSHAREQRSKDRSIRMITKPVPRSARADGTAPPQRSGSSQPVAKCTATVACVWFDSSWTDHRLIGEQGRRRLARTVCDRAWSPSSKAPARRRSPVLASGPRQTMIGVFAEAGRVRALLQNCQPREVQNLRLEPAERARVIVNDVRVFSVNCGPRCTVVLAEPDAAVNTRFWSALLFPIS
jgi:hypothetical protein